MKRLKVDGWENTFGCPKNLFTVVHYCMSDLRTHPIVESCGGAQLRCIRPSVARDLDPPLENRQCSLYR